MTPNTGLPLVRTPKNRGDHEITEPALREWLASRAKQSTTSVGKR